MANPHLARFFAGQKVLSRSVVSVFLCTLDFVCDCGSSKRCFENLSFAYLPIGTKNGGGPVHPRGGGPVHPEGEGPVHPTGGGSRPSERGGVPSTRARGSRSRKQFLVDNVFVLIKMGKCAYLQGRTDGTPPSPAAR